jgi:hypothetical protein
MTGRLCMGFVHVVWALVVCAAALALMVTVSGLAGS